MPLRVAVVFAAACMGTAVLRALAQRYGWLVLPRADRWHRQPTALHGGMGFCPAFLAGAWWSLGLEIVPYWRHGQPGQPYLPPHVVLPAALLLGALVMLGCGLWDDLKPLRPATKLLCQAAATSLFVAAGGVFPLTGLPVLDILITYFWFLGIINAVNLLDNMDGLASGVVILASLTLCWLTLQSATPTSGSALATFLCLAFVAATLGFWVHNRPPATIFMGDSGSLCLGYTLAGLAVPSQFNGFFGVSRVENPLGHLLLLLLLPMTVLAVPIFDTTLVTITRKWRAQKASQGGRDHSSHRLVALGLSEKQAVWVLYGLTALGGMVARGMQSFPTEALALFGMFGLLLVLTGVYLGRVTIQTPAISPPLPRWTPLVSQAVYKHHAAEILLDLVLIPLCFYAAYLLRFEGFLAPVTTAAMVSALPFVVVSCLLAFLVTGIYRGQWWSLSVPDLPHYALGIIGGVTLSLASVTFVTRFTDGHSRSVYLIFGILLLLAIVSTRLSFRLFDTLVWRQRSLPPATPRIPVLIYGAGKAGKLLYEEIMSNAAMQGYTTVGFIDDDFYQVGHKLCGVPVKHGQDWLRQTWPVLPEIWISSRFIPDEQARNLVRQWHGTLRVRRLRLQLDPTMETSLEEHSPLG